MNSDFRFTKNLQTPPESETFTRVSHERLEECINTLREIQKHPELYGMNRIDNLTYHAIGIGLRALRNIDREVYNYGFPK